VKLSQSRIALPDEPVTYEVSFQTRSFDQGFIGKTIREVVTSALESIEDAPEGDIDPIVPSWYQLSRMQREFVIQTLRQHSSEHLAAAAAANLAHSRDAEVAYLKADAMIAALNALEVPNVNHDGELLPQEPLQARTATEPERDDGDDARSARREALAETVKNLKAKNKRRARGTKQA